MWRSRSHSVLMHLFERESWPNLAKTIDILTLPKRSISWPCLACSWHVQCGNILFLRLVITLKFRLIAAGELTLIWSFKIRSLWNEALPMEYTKRVCMDCFYFFSFYLFFFFFFSFHENSAALPVVYSLASINIFSVLLNFQYHTGPCTIFSTCPGLHLVLGPGGGLGLGTLQKADWAPVLGPGFWARLDVSINNFMVEHRWEWRQLLSTLSRGLCIETRHLASSSASSKTKLYLLGYKEFYIRWEESTYNVCSWIMT